MATTDDGKSKGPRMTVETATPVPKVEQPVSAAQTTHQSEPSARPAQTPRPAPKSHPKLVVTASLETDSEPVQSNAPSAAESATQVASVDEPAPTYYEEPIAQSTTPASAQQGTADASKAGQAPQATSQGSDAVQPTSQGASFAGARRSVTTWVHRTFPGHEHAFWGAVVALLVALLTFAIGFARMLFVCLLVIVGIAVGQILDGDPKIIRAIRELFSGDRTQR